MKVTVRFTRHGGIYRSDVSSHLADQGRSAAFRTGPAQPKGRAGSFHALLIVATSSDRLFLNGVLASIARLRFTGTPILNPFRDRAP
jgi:hypothetical protein